MNRAELHDLLCEDLANEVDHMMFYLRAATEVEGLHREELREFFLKQAREEMGHVDQFSTMASYLGDSVGFEYTNKAWACGGNPRLILAEASRMEQEVANNYADRLKATEAPSEGSYDPAVATAHVFYEDQIKDSQMTAWELKKWLTHFS